MRVLTALWRHLTGRGVAGGVVLRDVDMVSLLARTPREGLTTDRHDPRLTRGVDTEPVPQADVYLVLSEEERRKGFVEPVRRTYLHVDGCGAVTSMGLALSETYARDPEFYGATYCTGCGMHRPVGEFMWAGTSQRVGSRRFPPATTA